MSNINFPKTEEEAAQLRFKNQHNAATKTMKLLTPTERGRFVDRMVEKKTITTALDVELLIFDVERAIASKNGMIARHG